MRLITCSLLVASLFACGKSDNDSPAKAAPRSDGALYVATAAAMPACDAASNDRIVYVADEKALKACLAGAWTPVDLSAKTMAIKADLTCAGTIGDTGVHYDYSLTYFTTGDLFVSAVIRGMVSQSSKSVFYTHGQVGAQNGTILVIADVVGEDNSGVWTFSMEQADAGPTFKYQDPDVPEGATYNQPKTDCVVSTQ